MPRHGDHITVCVCTYRRPKMLLHLLKKLECQRTDHLFTYSSVVVDNDVALSAAATINSFKEVSSMEVTYLSEPVQNIALARNAAVQNAKGDYIALIDDDEFPEGNWLVTLYKTFKDCRADGILGPVRPCFEDVPPKWIVNGKFYEKGEHETGYVLEWQDTRTSNVLFRSSIFDDVDNLFRPEFGRGGEDMDFFQRAMNKNYVFVWCGEASVWETIPPERFKRVYMIRRALLRGKLTVGYPTFGLAHIGKSVIAVPVYTACLPFAFAAGQHHFMKIATKLFEHIGRLLGLCGVDVIREYYVTK